MRVTRLELENEKRNEKKKETIKKVILMLLLMGVLLFVFLQRDCLKNEARVHVNKDDINQPTREVSLIGDHVIEQDVVMRSDSFRKVYVYFRNGDIDHSSGLVKLELLDKAGNVLKSTSIDASLINENSFTRFLLGGDSEAVNSNRIVSTYGKDKREGIVYVDEGETYTFRITTEDVKCDKKFVVVLSDYSSSKDDSLHNVVIDGKTQDKTCLYMALAERYYSHKTMALFLGMIFLTLIFVLLPFNRIDEWFAEKTDKDWKFSTLLTRLMFLAAPTAAFFVSQKFVGHGLHKFVDIATNPVKGWLNYLIIGLIWWLIYTVCNRVRFTSMLTVALAAFFGLINYSLILFRDSPLVATDIAQLGTAMQVANSYTLSFNKPFLWAVLLSSLWCIACFAPPGHKGFEGKKRLIPLAILLVWFGAFYQVCFAGQYIENHELRVSSFKPKGSYTKNGCPLSFVITVRNSIVKKPDDYDPKKIEELATKYESDKAISADKVSAETPNVIFVMNESFADLKVLGDFKTNVDNLSYYRSLKGNVIKGWMHPSIFGGSTANSEFESLTGFTMSFLPFQSVAYRSIIKDETPSLTQSMNAMGYGGSIAFHPGMRNSYNRDKVYPLLGFKEQISYEDLKEPKAIRDYVSDEYDYEYVEKEFEEFRKEESKKPFYMFNVTIQNHGGYDPADGKVDAGVDILTQDCRQITAIQYMNLMKLSDEALKKLIDYYSNLDEETVIVLFGDHQPRISGDFYSAMEKEHPEMSDLEWSDLQHQVPFMIWANYDINKKIKKATEKQDGDLHLSANYITPYFKSLLGMPMTGFDKYLLDLQGQLPVVNAICYQDAAGKLYSYTDSSKYDNILNEYKCVQYNGLIDYSHRVDEFFNLK